MTHHPPPDENEKLAEVPQTPGQLTVDEQNNALTSPDGTNPALTRPPFIFAQHTQNDKAGEPGCFVVSVPCDSNYTPADSIRQNCSTTLADLDAEIERERARFIAAGDNDDDETFVDSFMRLLSLYESCANARREAAR